MNSALFFKLVVVIALFQTRNAEYTCDKFENDTNFQENDILPVPLNGNLDECVQTCSQLGIDCSGLTYDYSSKDCYLKKFTQPIRVDYSGSK